MKKVTVILLTGLICLLGVTALAYNEAPMLRVQVAAGELPPVEERISEEPLVVIPVEEIGQYGGKWSLISVGKGNLAHVHNYLRYGGIVRWSSDMKSVVPDVAKNWDMSDNAKVFTFHLRKGMKWSDGVPFTADDVMFYFEDILSNKELTPIFPTYFMSGGEFVKVKKIDEYTVKLTFNEVYPLFLQRMAGPYTGEIYAPKHYLEQFHPKYTSKEKLEKMVKEAKFDYWFELFLDKNDFWATAERPTVRAWKVVVPYGITTQVSLERNPYFWKVDPAGNQLPYIDKAVVSIVTDMEIVEMKAIAGEIDMSGSPVGESVANYPLYMENREKGDYRVLMLPTGEHAIYLTFNQNHKDPVLKKILCNRKFRYALSHAINREEINDIVFFGKGEICQPGPYPDLPSYHEPLWKAHIKYDPEETNRLLDEIGLNKRDEDGYRLRPDGKRLTLLVETYPAVTAWVRAGEMICKYWKEVGVKATVKVMERSFWETRWQAAEHNLCLTNSDYGQGWMAGMGGHAYTPFRKGWGTTFGSAWADWFLTKGKSGEEPPEEVKKMVAIKEELKVTVDAKKRLELFKKILAWRARELYGIGICTRPPKAYIVKNKFRNVPERFYETWGYGCSGPTNPCQYFWKR